jgi:integrase
MAKERNPLRTFDYTGPIGRHLTDFIAEKRAVGFKYSSEAFRLREIDRLCIELNTPPDTLPRNLVEEWSVKRPHESHKTWQDRQVVMRQLTKYFINHDLDTHLTTIEPSRQSYNFVPYIFTDSEIARIFTAADSLVSHNWSPQRQEVLSLLFRLLYSCGLRLGEALSLKVKDVDLEKGVLTVLDGKNRTDRYVPMSLELTQRCRDFYDKIHFEHTQDSVFLPAPDGGFYSRGSMQYAWKQILRLASIPRTDDGPRIHDLRHTFAVGCLKAWVHNGKDLSAMLPVLCAYLGHKRLSATGRYLRLTADMYPEVVSTFEAHFGGIIPEGDYLYEED